MEKKKILMIVGSFRKASFNKQLAENASGYLLDKAQTSFLNYSDLPLFNEDMEHDTLPSLTRILECIKSCDGVWIFTPEYNHSIPGVLKNLLDWISRPLPDSGSGVLFEKPVTFSGAGGSSGTACAQDALLLQLNFLSAKIMYNPRTAVALPKEAFQTGKMELSEDSLKILKKQAEAFVAFI